MIDVTPSSGNVFKDLGLPNPEERLAKAKLAHKIRCLIADQKMTQKDAAVFLGLSRYKMTGTERRWIEDFYHRRSVCSVGKTGFAYEPQQSRPPAMWY